MIIVQTCHLAAAEHMRNARSFAHVFHREAPDAEVICVAPEYYDLPVEFKVGVFLHELGHLALKNREHTEEDADRKAERMSGIRIYRREYGRAKNLECIRAGDVERARAFIFSKVLEA